MSESKQGQKSLRVEKTKDEEEKKPLDLATYLVQDSYQRIKLMSGKSLSIKPWRMKEEKDFLFIVETKPDDEELLIEECLNLSKRCVDPKDHVIFNTLTKTDLLHLISQQRKLSRGRIIDLTFRCINPECSDWVPYNEAQQKKTGRLGMANTLQEDKVNIDEHIKITEFKNEPVIIGRFTFYLQELPYHIYHNLELKHLKNKSEEEQGLNKFTYNLVKKSVHRIEVDGNPVVFNPDVLEKFLDQLSRDEYDKLANKVYDNASGFEVVKNVKCAFCGNEVPIVYNELFDILVF